MENKPVILFIASILSNIYLENLHDTPFIDETSTGVHKKKLNLDNQPIGNGVKEGCIYRAADADVVYTLNLPKEVM